MPYRVRISEAVQQALKGLPDDDVRQVRAKLEEVAEMSEGFPPVNPLWSRRLDVQMLRMRVNIGRHQVEFEIDTPAESLRVLELLPDANPKP